MLSFLKRLPDNSVSIIMSGINRSLIMNEEYRRQIFLEIERVLNKDGGFLCKDSEPPKDLQLEVVSGKSKYDDFIFQKPEHK